MEIRVFMKTGMLVHWINTRREAYKTLKRYLHDPAVKVTVKL